MTPTHAILGSLALVALVLFWAWMEGAFEKPEIPHAVPPWITRDEADQIFKQYTVPQGVQGNAFALVTFGHLTDALTARDQKLRELIANTPDEIHRMVIATLNNLPATYVPRNEFEPLLAAYCRKSLADGELLARVSTLMRAMIDSHEETLRAKLAVIKKAHCESCAPLDDLTTMAAKADASHARLQHAVRTTAKPRRKARR